MVVDLHVSNNPWKLWRASVRLSLDCAGKRNQKCCCRAGTIRIQMRKPWASCVMQQNNAAFDPGRVCINDMATGCDCALAYWNTSTKTHAQVKREGTHNNQNENITTYETSLFRCLLSFRFHKNCRCEPCHHAETAFQSEVQIKKLKNNRPEKE